MATNSLGLDFEQLSVQDSAAAAEAVSEVQSPSAEDSEKGEVKEKKQAYVNRERVNTGGAPRDKLSDDALAERMSRIREQNEKIKQRRLDVKADEDAFKKSQEADRAKRAHNRKIQEHQAHNRVQNQQRKMNAIQSREWDSEKKFTSSGGAQSEEWARGRGGRGGRGRGGRGRGAGRPLQSSAPENGGETHVDRPSEVQAPAGSELGPQKIDGKSET